MDRTLKQRLQRSVVALPVLIFYSACCPAESSVTRITSEELYGQITSGDAVAVDTRDFATYRKAHIMGAVHIPLTEVEARASQLPRDKLIATYCS